MTKQIHLTQGQFALVDDQDYERLMDHKWFAYKGWNTFYAARTINKNGKHYQLQMHHEIAGFPPLGFQTDHEDGNGLNNQRHNLRYATKRQNQQNLKSIQKASQFPGVTWHKPTKKWHARIKIHGKNRSLGYFHDEKEAFEAYKNESAQLGEPVLTANMGA